MTQRRERLKKQLIRNMEQILEVECQLALEEHGIREEDERTEEDGQLESDPEEEEDDLQCVRQTRFVQT